jgi:C-terminal processing protease CtpA/Prc
MEFIAKLRDGHTGISMPKQLSDEAFARPLIRTRLVEDKVLITRVLSEDLKKNNIEAGLEITEIDGVPVKKYAEEKVKPFASASTPQDLETRIYNYQLLSGSAKNPVELTLRDAKGNLFKKTVVRATVEEQNKVGSTAQPMEYKMLPGNVAYVALNTFGNDRAAEMFAEKYDEISKADAIIFDVRENGGGNSSVGWNILGYLTDKPFGTSKWYTRQYRPSFRAWERPQSVYGQNQSWAANGKNLYTKSVVVLTSPRTYSAAEDFTLAFSILKRGTIIGEATGGSSGQPLFIGLPGGGGARICTKRDQFPDGRDFVGKGIQPDKTVKQTVADFRNGRDTVLEAALKELKK